MAKEPDYQEFNKFQTYFYTNVNMFNQFSNFEIKTFSFQLLSTMNKGFPSLSDDIMNVYCSGFINFQECPSLIRALQRRFVNGFVSSRMPQFIYYKSATPKKTTEKKVVAKERFSAEIANEIKSRLMMDEKDYQYYYYSERVQKLGNLLQSINSK